MVGLPPPSSSSRRVLFPRPAHYPCSPSTATTATSTSSSLASSPLRAPLESVVIDNSNANGDKNSSSAHVRVCIRVRPLLPSDVSNHQGGNDGIIGAAKLGNAFRLSSPTSSTRKTKSFARDTQSSFRHATPKSALKTPGGSATKLLTPSQLKAQREKEQQQSEGTSNMNAANLLPAWYTTPNNTQIISQAPHTHPDPDRAATYAFDRVYSPSDSTRRLYEESIRGIIHSVVEGYHGSVFAYGQTNSGKTFTMTGCGKDGQGEEGVVRMAVEEIFRKVQETSLTDGREYLMRVSYLEIYNEQIYDLLALPSGTGNAGSSSTLHHHHLPPSTAVRIFESRTEGVVIRGLREEIVTCPEEVFSLLDVGDAKRKVGSTGMNRSSSRSHSVFRLVLESRVSNSSNHSSVPSLTPSSNSSVNSEGSNAIQGPVRISSLSLVDLAGSESVKATGATGTRQKEGQYINKSLLTLGHVVHKLSEISLRAEQQQNNSDGSIAPIIKEHIPYRDSKLTRLLQPSLGGNARVCIISCISPALANLEESHNTLKFATRAKKIQQHAKITEVADEKTLLRSYREEIEELKRQLKEARELAALAGKDHIQQQNQQRGILRSYDSSSEEEDQDDTHVLVSAIKNLESLILNAKTKSSQKTTRESSGTVEGRDGALTSPTLNDTLNKSELDSENDEGNGIVSSNVPYSPSSNDDEIHISTEVADSNLTTPTQIFREDEEDQTNLLEELHRIQGMLGTVMKKRKNGSLGTSKKIFGQKASFHSPERDAEVERLRMQLQEQEVATTMRKADSSYLQGQLSEKEK
ncbi:hypothetical protein ACHAXS_007740 [Conticribra weissflogii]